MHFLTGLIVTASMQRGLCHLSKDGLLRFSKEAEMKVLSSQQQIRFQQKVLAVTQRDQAFQLRELELHLAERDIIGNGRHMAVVDIRLLREECGWTQEKLAEKVGVSRDSVMDHEAKRAKPSPKTLKAYRDVFSEALGREIR
jgi:DNA-binding XRE family transcriptional regulator